MVMNALTVFKLTLLFGAAAGMISFMLGASVWPGLIGLTCALYLAYMVLFNWDEDGNSYFKGQKK